MKKFLSIILSFIMAVSVFAAGRRGDTNGDGEIDNKDVVTLFRFVSGGAAGAVPENCDFNGDGEIDNKDVVALFRAVSSGEIPPEEDPKETVLIDFNAVQDDCLRFFTKQAYCETDFTDDTDEGKVLRITTKNVISSAAKPTVFFNYGDYSAAAGEKPASFTEKPFVVMKVKAQDVHDRLFSLLGAESDKGSVRTSNETSAKIPGGDGWHYIIFDFTGAKTPDKFNSFRMIFEQTAGKNGEILLISEIRVCTAEEAAGYIIPDVYPVETGSEEGYTLKVMQFNVQTENGNSTPFITRSEMYRKLLDELQPDVVGMQEVTVTWRKWLDSYVFNDSYAGVGEMREPYGEANPIYYRKDKFELLDSGTFWLSDTPDVAGSKTEGANYPRICTWVVLKDVSDGTEFVHFNTHLDHNGNNESSVGNTIRKKQIGVIIKFAQRFKDMPMFLTGDLNNRRTTSEGKTYALIKMIQGDTAFTDADGTEYTIKLRDARLKAPVTVDENHIATMTKYYDESNSAYNPAREPIDYVFYNPANTDPLTYQTFLITEDGAWISDHLPLFATFCIKPSVE